MTEFKGTPGPWAAKYDDYGDEIWFGGEGRGMWTISDGVAFLGGKSEIVQANARLIAAAPRLLEALEQTVPWLEHDMPPAPDHICGPESACDMLCVEFAEASMALRQARAAIAEALGND